MIGTVSHVVFCVLAQLILAHFSGDYWLGVITGTCFYLGREVAQAEGRWDRAFGATEGGTFLSKLRAFDPRAWNAKGLADWIAPMLATGGIAYFM